MAWVSDMARRADLTNIPAGNLRCSICFEVKPNTDFPYYSNQFYNKGSDHPWTGKRKRINNNCKPCRSQRGKERRAFEKKYEEFFRIGKKAGELCECCKKPVYESYEDIPEGVDGAFVWQKDHDHETGNFRGWLCKRCNTGIGLCGDTLDDLKNVVEFLEKAKEGTNPSQIKAASLMDGQ